MDESNGSLDSCLFAAMTVSDVQLPLFSDSIAFIQRIHRVFVILRHDRCLVARSRFYGQQPHRDGLCIEEVSGHDETPPILPFRPSITVGIALYTMRPRLSLLLETGPLKGPASPHAADMPPARRFTGYERETVGNCFRFEPFSSRNGGEIYRRALVDIGP